VQAGASTSMWVAPPLCLINKEIFPQKSKEKFRTGSNVLAKETSNIEVLHWKVVNGYIQFLKVKDCCF